MIRIAHRGNLFGPKVKYENSPNYLQNALNLGFHIEVDAWHTPEGLFLGHDHPTYKTDIKFFRDIRIWTHCKDVKTLLELSKYPDINCFSQEADMATITSLGYVWMHSDTTFYGKKSIVTYLNKGWKSCPLSDPPYGICSDYATSYPNEDPPKTPFDVLLVDIDGIMTNGTKTYNTDGVVISKTYCDLDFTAIKRFKAAGIDICFISGDQRSNRGMANLRKIDFYYSPSSGKDKIEHLPELYKKYPNKRFAYVGDDYYDIAIMNSVDMSFCPNNSPAAVKRVSTIILPVQSGKGVLAAIYDIFEDRIPCIYPRNPINAE